MALSTVSIGRARQDFAQWIHRVTLGGERIILTVHGQPKAVLVSLEDLHLLEQISPGKAQRLAALERARVLGERIRAERSACDVDAVTLLHQVREELFSF